jgi:hypothetical protein
VSSFTELLEQRGIDLEAIEPDEIRFLCSDPVFRAVARYCLGKETVEEDVATATRSFDADELGLDPEEDIDECPN